MCLKFQQKKIRIVGGGLAGSILALHFLDSKIPVTVYSSALDKSSSFMAAGIFNPITGKKLLKTWMADLIFPFLHKFYSEQEAKLGQHFFYPLPMIRPIFHQSDLDQKLNELHTGELGPFADILSKSACSSYPLVPTLGALYIHKAGFLDVQTFLYSAQMYLKSKGVLIESNAKIDVQSNADIWIDCTGYQAAHSPIWSFLPWTLNKGQWFISEKVTDAPFFEEILNKNVFIVPMAAKRTYKVGATYEWTDLEGPAHNKSRVKLLEQCKKMTTLEIQVAKDIVGIRPATKDRRPFLGRHPEYQHVYIFNGFGSKAVSLVPYFAHEMVRFVLGLGTLHKECDIQRFQNKT